MSLGYGVGEILGAIQLAWTVYKECREAPESFDHISKDVLSLHAVLNETDEEFSAQSLPKEKGQRLKVILDGCKQVLQEIEAMVIKYQSLGTQSKRMYDRWRYDADDASKLRERLEAQVIMLTAFISTNSLSRIERKLDRLAKEYRDGKRGGSAVSRQTVDSLNADDRQTWREIRKELESVGITVAAFQANKVFIFHWFSDAVAAGAFDEEEHEPLTRVLDNTATSQDIGSQPKIEMITDHPSPASSDQNSPETEGQTSQTRSPGRSISPEKYPSRRMTSGEISPSRQSLRRSCDELEKSMDSARLNEDREEEKLREFAKEVEEEEKKKAKEQKMADQEAKKLHSSSANASEISYNLAVATASIQDTRNTPRVPRIPKLLAKLSRPQEALARAIEESGRCGCKALA